MMSLRSVIPHLARAIAEKRGAQPWNCTQNNAKFAQIRYQSSVKSSKSPPSPAQKYAGPIKSRPAETSSIQSPAQVRRKSIYYTGTAGFAFFVGMYCVYLYVNWTNSVESHGNSDDHLPFNADVSNRWKELGRDFDDEVELSEKVMFMKGKRRKLVERAYGNVLEVSVGTGRNLQYYDLQAFNPIRSKRRNIITHLTLNDQSGVIIAAAEDKLEKILSRQEKPPASKFDFVVGDAGVSGIIQRPEGGFDTIVQTMGICSMVDPVGFLRKMGQLCRQPGEQSKTPDRWRANDDDGKGGQILLLEHGRGHFDWLNWVLDTGASLHAHRFGCWWNKDVEEIIKKSGLEIEKIKRYHGGTTWMIILRPKAQGDTEKADQLEASNIKPQRIFSSSRTR